MNYLPQIVCLFLFFCLPSSILGQNFYFLTLSDNNKVIEQGEIVRLTCTLDSLPEAKASYQLKILSPNQLKMLSPEIFTINHKNTQKRTFPIKFLIPSHDFSLSEIMIKAILVEKKSQQIITETVTHLTIRQKPAVELNFPKTEWGFTTSETTWQIPVRVVNKKNSIETVFLTWEDIPPNLFVGKTATSLYLKPLQDTTYYLVLDKSTKYKWQQKLRLNLRARTSTTSTSTNKHITVQPIYHEKKYQPKNKAANRKITLGSTYFYRGQQNHILNFTSHGKIKTASGTHHFNILTENNASSQQWQLYNTQYIYETSRQRLQVGNINKTFVVPLYGRGLHYTLYRDQQRYQLGWVNGEGNLIAPQNGLKTFTGNTFFMETNTQLSATEELSSHLIGRQRQHDISGMVGVSGKSEREEQLIEGQLTLSGLQAKDISSDPQINTGVEAEFFYKNRWKKWTFSSDNHYSSPYYAGLQSGYIFLREQIDWEFREQSKLQLVANWNKLAPLFSMRNYLRNAQQSNYKILLHQQWNKNWSFILSPFYWYDQRNYLDFSQPEQVFESKAWHLESSLRWSKKQQLFDISFNAGQYRFGKMESQQTLSQTFIAKILWSHQHWGLNINYQEGAYYLFEKLEVTQSSKPRRSFNIEPRLQYKWFKNKLQWQLLGQLRYNSVRELLTTSIQNHLHWQISPFSNTHLSLYYLNAGSFNTLYASVGFNHHFQYYQSDEKAFQLKARFYEDKNQNQQQDEDELILDGLYVEIDDLMFRPDATGKIAYKNLSVGEYVLQTRDMQHRFVPRMDTVLLTQDLDLLLPMTKMTVLEGRVEIKEQKFAATRLYLHDLVVVARNKNNVLFKTLIQHQGTFQMYLPQDSYTLYLEHRSHPHSLEVDDNYRRVTLPVKDGAKEVFKVQAKERKVRVKRF